MKENYPNVMKMEQPLTFTEYCKLIQEYAPEIVREVLEAMENYKPLLKDNRSAYRTIRNWISRRKR